MFRSLARRLVATTGGGNLYFSQAVGSGFCRCWPWRYRWVPGEGFAFRNFGFTLMQKRTQGVAMRLDLVLVTDV